MATNTIKMPQNIEIKAKCSESKQIHQILAENKADFIGLDHQIDTYFKVPNGRLKLRQGNIENHLIYYNRPNQAGPKKSEVLLYSVEKESNLKDVLTTALGEKVVVDKKRYIYFIDNVKFHVDEVKGLGNFIEIEAIDKDGNISLNTLKEQCNFYMELFGIAQKDLIEVSYSDLILGM